MPYRTLAVVTALAATLALGAPRGHAQDEETPAPPAAGPQAEEPADPTGPEPDPQELLSRALLDLRNLDEMAVRARVTQEAASAAPGGGGAAVQIMIAGGRRLQLGGDDFEGEVEAWRGVDDVTVVLSTSSLPGFRLFEDGRGDIVRQVTYTDDIPGFGLLEAELIPLLDRRRFLEHVLAADLHAERDPRSGRWTFRGPVAREVINPLQGGMVPMGLSLRVIRCELSLVVSPEAKLERIGLVVVRNDPMREARARGMRIGPGPAPAPEDAQAHEIEGGRTRYDLTLLPNGPSEDARAFRREMLRLRGAERKDDAQAPAGEGD